MLPSSTPSTHDYVYTSLLGAFGFFLLIGMIMLGWMRFLPTIDADGRFILLMLICIEGVFLTAICAVLVIRIAFPAYRRWPTLWLNIILLLMVPIGTVLAIYGFWKVDKGMRGSLNQGLPAIEGP
ncbi:MAG: hypothetical protein M3O30_03465 [Planctomycetota bacterium]|nr:hypothetical protein [Planctomycetota bacterium]